MSGNVAQIRTVEQAIAHADAAHAKLSAHEDLCAQRYGSISDSLVELRSDIKDQQKLIWGLLLSVAGFAVVTLVAVLLKKGGLM